MHRVAVMGLCFMACAVVATGQFKGGEEKAAARKSDIPYIKCQVCQHLVREAARSIKKRRDGLNPGKKLMEEEIMDALEGLCDPDGDTGSWIAKTDLQESGTALKLVDMGEVGECGIECRTISRVCTDIFEDIEMELAEELYRGKQRADLTSTFCHIKTDACAKKPPPLTKDRPAGEAFHVLDLKELEMKKMMKQMESMGMGGQMYNREQLKDEMERMEEEIKESSSSSQPSKRTPDKGAAKTSAFQKSWNAGVSAVNSVADSIGNFASRMKSKLGKQEEL